MGSDIATPLSLFGTKQSSPISANRTYFADKYTHSTYHVEELINIIKIKLTMFKGKVQQCLDDLKLFILEGQESNFNPNAV